MGSISPAWVSGYYPRDIQAAYNLKSYEGRTGTVAVVDAYDNPYAESDLAIYRQAMGLPPCTTANGCFHKLNQSGVQGSYPAADEDWAAEESLDLDMVSATCVKCKIILIEAKTNNDSDLGMAVNKVASLHPNAISNSYGEPEFSGELSLDAYYNHPGMAITVSSGDSGNGVLEYPAASKYVTAVGGTSLYTDSSSRGWTESAWSGAGSGCSQYVSKPTWQPDKFSGECATHRTIADVSAVADPNTGVAVYDTYGPDYGGWTVFGGTSVSSPIIASVYALAGNTSSITSGSFPYTTQKTVDAPCSTTYHPSGLFDIADYDCFPPNSLYLTTAVPGFDGPTGLGSPNGTSAF